MAKLWRQPLERTSSMEGKPESRRSDALRRLLQHRDPRARGDAVSTADKLGETGLGPDIMQCLRNDSAWRVRMQAAIALGHLKYSPGIPALKATMQDQNEYVRVREWATWAVGELATTREEAYLMRLVESRVWPEELRRVLLGALKKVRLESVKAPAKVLQRQLRRPGTNNPTLQRLVSELEDLESERSDSWSARRTLREQMKRLDEDYFRRYMEWIERKARIST